MGSRGSLCGVSPGPLVCCVRPPLGLLAWSRRLPLCMRRATPCLTFAYFSPLGVHALRAQTGGATPGHGATGFQSVPASLLQPSVSPLLKDALIFPAWKAGRPRCGRWPRAGQARPPPVPLAGPADEGLEFSAALPVRPGLVLARCSLQRAAGSESDGGLARLPPA